MQTVYQAANGIEAQIVVDVLADHGIRAFVQGAGLGSAAGELPTLGLVRVLVSDDAQAAEAIAIVRDWEARKPEPDQAEEPQPSLPPSRSRGRDLSWFSVGVITGAFAALAVAGARKHSHDEGGPGVADVRWTYDGDRVVRGELDYDADGRADVVNVYATSPGNFLQTSDEDFDGRMETESRYRNDLPQTSSTDHDGDGFAEYRATYSGWLVAEESWLDPKSRQVTLRTRFKQGIATTSEIDSDNDGRLDTLRHHDHRGEIVSSRPM